MPLIGTVQAAGVRGSELASILQSRYCSQGIYAHPLVQVVSAIGCGLNSDPEVTVGGQVRLPGPIPFTQGMSLADAIRRAGGATEFGSLGRLKVIRDGTQRTFDGTKIVSETLLLQNHDVVEVPQKVVFGN